MIAPYHTELFAPNDTFPMTEALGATKTSVESVGFLSKMALIRWCLLTRIYKHTNIYVTSTDTYSVPCRHKHLESFVQACPRFVHSFLTSCQWFGIFDSKPTLLEQVVKLPLCARSLSCGNGVEEERKRIPTKGLALSLDNGKQMLNWLEKNVYTFN